MINNIAVCGLGKLGSPIAASFAAAGLSVMGYDLDQKKISNINWKVAPVQEPGLEEAIRKSGKRLQATAIPEEAVRGTQACIFVAPTPSLPDGSFDNQYLLDGIEKISLAVGDRPYIFIIASTVTPGSCNSVFLPVLRRYSGKTNLVYKPELIALGTVMHDLANPDVALIGAENGLAAEEVHWLYARLITRRIEDFKIMSFVEAELAKISLNCAITMKISFANQVSLVARRLGADARAILEFVGSDSRIGKKALRPGMPFGGPCFPRDNRMFQHVAEKAGAAAPLAKATDTVNEQLLTDILNSIPEDGTIGILGLAYKAGTLITEESAGMALKLALMEKGRSVRVHDPLLSPNYLLDAAECRTVVVTTDCQEYRNLHFHPDQILIDPMNVTAGINSVSPGTKCSTCGMVFS